MTQRSWSSCWPQASASAKCPCPCGLRGDTAAIPGAEKHFVYLEDSVPYNILLPKKLMEKLAKGKSKKFLDKYPVKSYRLAGYDYSAQGAYFITIKTHQMKCYFGEVVQ